MSPKAKREFYFMMHTLLFVVLFLMGKYMIYDPYIKNDLKVNKKLLTAEAINTIEESPVVAAPSYAATIVAVGDVMVHKSELDAAFDKSTNTYNFENIFTNIKPYLKGDIVYGNLEAPIAGQELKYTGYPTFNAPIEIVKTLKENFFTHLSVANNHALDRGSVGLSHTVSNVESSGIIALGARNDKTKTNFQVSEINGLKIGFLSYTYGTNGFKLSPEKAYMLSYINRDQIKKGIEDLKKQNIDATVVTFHFGEEYKLVANTFQKEIAQLACDSGADIVLGAHPHVLEPIVYLNSGKCLVAYSLGNFISGMSAPYTDLGGILKIGISKKDNILSMTPEFMGTWVKRAYNKAGIRTFTVVPLDTDKIPENVIVTKTEQERLANYRTFVENNIKSYISKP